MAKRYLARGSSSSHFALTEAPRRLEDEIQALTSESIEESLEAIQAAFQQRFAAPAPSERRPRKKAAAK